MQQFLSNFQSNVISPLLKPQEKVFQLSSRLLISKNALFVFLFFHLMEKKMQKEEKQEKKVLGVRST